ncbi:LysR substrate-binding domain-containing protein [Paraburkholderia sediminicola]|uniref:LysR substrate-binding domain-containing protein n=1 Tax=Paraburkholderia sediminicola TaxID=458836 RepID=UPI0038B822C6
MLELRQLRYFVAVAEAEHVGQAAAALHISQSPLSRQIMLLEGQLGLALFERNKQRIRLSRAGRELLIEARDLLAQAEHLEVRARRVALGESGTLTIGYVEGAVHSGILPMALRRMRTRRPDIRIEMIQQRSARQIEMLRHREIDFAVVYNPAPEEEPELKSYCLLREPMVLAVPADHQFATRTQVSAPDLDGQPWIARPRDLNPIARDRFLQACNTWGFVPDICIEATDAATTLKLVSAGVGLALVQQSISVSMPNPGLIFIALPAFPLMVQLHATYRSDDSDPVVAYLAELLIDSDCS